MPAPFMLRHQQFSLLCDFICPNCCWPRSRVQQWAAVLVGTDQGAHLSVVRVKKGEKEKQA